jgi:hypothetical protein
MGSEQIALVATDLIANEECAEGRRGGDCQHREPSGPQDALGIHDVEA